VIEGILPAVVVAEEAFVDPDGVALFPEEELVVAGAVVKRRTEFATARHCARAALSRLGVAPTPILPGERGAPQWPAGIVGSMTHCAGYRAAALAHRSAGGLPCCAQASATTVRTTAQSAGSRPAYWSAKAPAISAK
jgi:4'-phosphopantetheinyl transferase EntD